MTGKVALILEDEAIIALDVAQTLAAEGFEVASVPSRQAARAWLTANPPPTIAIVDVELTDGRALDIASDLAARRVPFVIHTGEALLPEDEPFRTGIVVPKPCSDDQLVAAVHSVLQR